MVKVESDIIVNAPIEKVWEIMTHHEGMIDWPDINMVNILKRGDNHPDGLGCVREVKAKGMYVKEEITRYDVNQQMDYLVMKTNLPIKHEGGSIILTEVSEGVKIHWVSKMKINLKNPFTRFIAKRMVPKKGKQGFDQILKWVKSELED